VAKNFQKPIYAIAGPTASGKTDLAVALALHLENAEIINFDSVQIYKEIEIATAKPTEKEKRGVVHHLINYVSPETNYTAAGWATDATQKIHEIESRGSIPVLVGGTGFYLRSLKNPFFDSPPTDENLRERLTKIKEKKGAEHLHELLKKVDPGSAQKLFPRDYVRSMRGLEVFFQTGRRLSEVQPERNAPPEFAGRIKIFVLNPPRDALYKKINERTEIHFEKGLVEEVKNLRAKGLRDDTNALGAHGYRRVCEFLRGERSLESAIERTKQDVRNYAKRQWSWFRREPDAIWLDGFGNNPETLEKLLQTVEI
jgi:tRNA dimethylallyltransferase